MRCERLSLPRVEECEPDDRRHDQTDADLGGEPAEVAHGNGCMKEEAKEVAQEEQDPSGESSRAEAAEIGAEGDDECEEDEGHGPVGTEGHAECQCRKHGDGEERRAHQLALGGRVRDREGRDHPDDRAEHLGDDQELVVGRCHCSQVSGGKTSDVTSGPAGRG